jgi:hypothetical protein
MCCNGQRTNVWECVSRPPRPQKGHMAVCCTHSRPPHTGVPSAHCIEPTAVATLGQRHARPTPLAIEPCHPIETHRDTRAREGSTPAACRHTSGRSPHSLHSVRRTATLAATHSYTQPKRRSQSEGRRNHSQREARLIVPQWPDRKPPAHPCSPQTNRKMRRHTSPECGGTPGRLSN